MFSLKPQHWAVSLSSALFCASGNHAPAANTKIILPHALNFFNHKFCKYKISSIHAVFLLFINWLITNLFSSSKPIIYGALYLTATALCLPLKNNLVKSCIPVKIRETPLGQDIFLKVRNLLHAASIFHHASSRRYRSGSKFLSSNPSSRRLFRHTKNALENSRLSSRTERS